MRSDSNVIFAPTVLVQGAVIPREVIASSVSCLIRFARGAGHVRFELLADRVRRRLQLRSASPAVAAEDGAVPLQQQNQVRKCFQQILRGHERVLSLLEGTVVPREVKTVTWFTEKMCTVGVWAAKLHANCMDSLCEGVA